MNNFVRSIRAASLLLLLLVAACAQAVPQILVIQLNYPATKDFDPNVPITDALATEFDQGGKVSSITWGILDPVFRAAVMEGRLVGMPDQPTLATAETAAKTLNAQYILVVQAKRVNGSLRAEGVLYKSGRSIWKGDNTLKITNALDDVSQSDTLRSVARTIAMRVQTEGLRILPVAPKVETVAPTKGQSPITPTAIEPVRPVVVPVPTNPTAKTSAGNASLGTTSPGTTSPGTTSPVPSTPVTPVPVTPAPAPGPSLDELWLTDAKEAIKKGSSASTVLFLRDGIDQRPGDPVRRRMLIDLLAVSDPKAAAEEARRAAVMMPEVLDFRVLAAKSWIRAGNFTEAQQDLNDAVAHQADSVSTLLLLVEVSLTRGDFPQALEHATKAVKKEPSGEALWMRALCRAALGGTAGVKQDLAEAQKAKVPITDESLAAHYKTACVVLDPAMDTTLLDVKKLLQRAVAEPKGAEVAGLLEQSGLATESRTAFFEGQKVPASEKTYHARRVLAHKLLRQSLMDIGEYIGGNADAILDARINLGEAIKQINLARNTTSGTSGGNAGGPTLRP